MFDDIGEKLMGAANLICTIGIVGSIVLGIIAMMAGSFGVIAGILIIVIGILVSWIGCWSLYAFGQIVDDIHSIRNEVSDVNGKIKLERKRNDNYGTSMVGSVQRKNTMDSSSVISIIKCPACGAENRSFNYICSRCGNELK